MKKLKYIAVTIFVVIIVFLIYAQNYKDNKVEENRINNIEMKLDEVDSSIGNLFYLVDDKAQGENR